MISAIDSICYNNELNIFAIDSTQEYGRYMDNRKN